MSVAAPVSLEHYLQHPTEPESETAFPIAERLIVLLDRYEQQGFGQVCPEQSMRLSAGKILIPDVSLLQPSDSAGNIVTEPPLLCVEILSPSDRFSFMVRKCREYLAWGVLACWILDPETGQTWISDPRGLHEVSPGGVLEAGPVTLSLAEVFPR